MESKPTPLSFQHVANELRLFCGEESLAALTRELTRAGCSRALVVEGRSVGNSGAMELLRKTLGPVLVGECISVRSNSPLPTVVETAQVLEKLKADCVIAVGGGSAAVTARAASILLAEQSSAQSLSTKRLGDGTFDSPRLRASKLPHFIVPTTPSTAFVKAGSAIHDVDSGHRLALFDPKTRVRALFVHPEFLGTAPTELVQSASLNTLVTAVEALASPKCDPLAEALLMQSLRLIGEHLNSTSLEDIATRERLVLAAILCGRGTEQSGGGLSSVLAHAIGARSNVPNGIVNAIVLPYTMRFNAAHTAARYSVIAKSLVDVFPRDPHLTKPRDAIAAIEALFETLSIPSRLRDIGIAQEDLPEIAIAAMSDWFIARNARFLTHESVLSILASCW
ncbi:iron-containing alcohol dehydrogenase family protein [Caballeronia novacaledonica]|uniref:Iron-containing alcohol dehydrogenase n=1 Tax=Caballeronia novacaledonica TaxID=1544861 RepID=A0AA37IE46_9BURK|nr:iron-containing alcohol dehydrogenase family protein [Caballeronia novacaledonica]GJH27069.1 iron-containing alcohol dehydrogenase [Caballeronia novacaledonica]